MTFFKLYRYYQQTHSRNSTNSKHEKNEKKKQPIPTPIIIISLKWVDYKKINKQRKNDFIYKEDKDDDKCLTENNLTPLNYWK